MISHAAQCSCNLDIWETCHWQPHVLTSCAARHNLQQVAAVMLIFGAHDRRMRRAGDAIDSNAAASALSAYMFSSHSEVRGLAWCGVQGLFQGSTLLTPLVQSIKCINYRMV